MRWLPGGCQPSLAVTHPSLPAHRQLDSQLCVRLVYFQHVSKSCLVEKLGQITQIKFSMLISTNQLVLWAFVSRLSNASLPTYWNISYTLGPHFLLVSPSRKYLQASHTVLFIQNISSPIPPHPASLFKLTSIPLPTQSQRSDNDACLIV